MASADPNPTEIVREGLRHYTLLFVLGLVLLLAFVCTLMRVLEGWAAIFLLGLENNRGGLEGFVVLNILAVALLFLCGVVGRRLGRARKRFEQTASPSRGMAGSQGKPDGSD